MAQSIKDIKGFNAKLRGVITSAKSQRDGIQELLVFGLEQAKKHNNLDCLSRLLNAAVGVRSLPTITIKDYIKEHATVRWVKNSKTKEMAFKKEGNNLVVKMPTVTWYNWEGGKKNQAQADTDVMVQAKAALTRWTNALKEGKVKDKEQAEAVISALKGVLPA